MKLSKNDPLYRKFLVLATTEECSELIGLLNSYVSQLLEDNSLHILKTNAFSDSASEQYKLYYARLIVLTHLQNQVLNKEYLQAQLDSLTKR